MDAVDKVLIIRYHEIAGIQVDAILSKEGGGTRGRGGHSGTRGRGGHSDARGRGGHRGEVVVCLVHIFLVSKST